MTTAGQILIVELWGKLLGPRAVVAAGLIVTKSFPNGYCLIVGNPTEFIKAIARMKSLPR